MISVILTSYKRPHLLQQQYDAICNQTIKPLEIILAKNNAGLNDLYDKKLLDEMLVIESNRNLGVWSRFSYALNCRGDYICIFDDDTIPGNRWLENCLECMTKQEGLYGTIGIRFKPDYYQYERFGWVSNNENIEIVDIVGHSWFLKKEWLLSFWREYPLHNSIYVGEDIHLSYVIQKYLKLNTYVPPHPINDKSMWGSINAQYGDDENSIYKIMGTVEMNNALTKYIDNNFQIFTICEHDLDMKLYEFYKNDEWDKLIFTAEMYISRHEKTKSREYNSILFYYGYAQMNNNKERAKEIYKEILENEPPDDIAIWTKSNLEFMN